MKRGLMLIWVLVLAGCAMTPADVVEQGTRHAWSSSLSPQAAAECIARNAENTSGTITAIVRAAPTSGAVETIVRTGEGGVMSLSQSRPAAKGATVEIWISPRFLTPERYLTSVSKGC